MKYSPIIAVVILMPGLFDDDLKAQDVRKLDSLKSKLEIATPKEKVKILLAMCIQYVDVNDQQALTYAETAYDVAKITGDTNDIVESGSIKGQLLAKNECIGESIAMMSYILPMAERNNFLEEQKRILNSLVVSYIMKADYAEALRFNSKSLLMRETEGDKAKISVAQNNMGLYQRKYIALNQRILTGRINDMLKVQEEFNEYENKRVIQTQKEVLLLHEQVSRNQRVINLLMSFTALILMMMIGYVLNRYKLKLKHNRMLDHKVRERTKLLDDGLIAMRRSHEVENQLIVKVSSYLKEHLSTMRGLINVILSEDIDKETIRKGAILISETEEKITMLVKRLPIEESSKP